MPDAREDLDRLPDAEFRDRLRAWLHATYPPEWRRPIVLRLRGAAEQRWLRMLHEGGWRCPGWPREHGGMGLSLGKQLIYQAEMEAFGVARVLDSGAGLLGPVLIRFGTAAQRARYLPGILNGDELWCQGYSEPNAGSDFASLSSTAVRDGDAFVINGSKIWTTMARECAWMFLLVRTTQGVRKQAGISFFLLDMATPGITIRPIANLAGDDEFAQVYFDNVRIPAENLVHELDRGWDVAKSLLGDERIFVGSPGLSGQAFDMLERLCDSLSLRDDPTTQDVVAALYCDLHDLRALFAEVTDAVIRGEAQSEVFSVLKILASELWKRIADAMVSLAGEHGGVLGVPEIPGCDTHIHRVFMISRPSSIYGGANEVQKNIVARALLGGAKRS